MMLISLEWISPVASEYIEGLSEYIIVDESSVEREYSHQKHNVTAIEESREDLKNTWSHYGFCSLLNGLLLKM